LTLYYIFEGGSLLTVCRIIRERSTERVGFASQFAQFGNVDQKKEGPLQIKANVGWKSRWVILKAGVIFIKESKVL
jgi:hypothetical protein